MQKKIALTITALVVVVGLVISVWLLLRPRISQATAPQPPASSSFYVDMAAGTREPTTEGTVELVDYQQEYNGETYDKTARVYVPAGYQHGQAANILYLTHGWFGSAESLSESVAPVLDQLIANGDLAPTLVVFATYYPDPSFATADFTTDYELNRFFAQTEVMTLMRAVESQYTTYATDTSDDGLRAGRDHRAFGGFSMGATTTWDVMIQHPDDFYGYLPMAGESWIDWVTGQTSNEDIASSIVSGLRERGYTVNDFLVVATVGSEDPALGDMSPQIEALRATQGDVMTGSSLIFWQDNGGVHDMTSIQQQVAYALPLIFPVSGEAGAAGSPSGADAGSAADAADSGDASVSAAQSE